MQYFGNVRHNSAAPNAFAEVVKMTNPMSAACWYVFKAWCMVSEFMFLELSDLT